MVKELLNKGSHAFKNRQLHLHWCRNILRSLNLQGTECHFETKMRKKNVAHSQNAIFFFTYFGEFVITQIYQNESWNLPIIICTHFGFKNDSLWKNIRINSLVTKSKPCVCELWWLGRIIEDTKNILRYIVCTKFPF